LELRESCEEPRELQARDGCPVEEKDGWLATNETLKDFTGDGPARIRIDVMGGS
jgi:hypothetical protein